MNPILYDRRPHELAVRTASRVVASTALHRQGMGGQFLYLLGPGVPWLLEEPIARAFAEDYGGVEITDEDRGALPVVLPPTDARQAYQWLRGRRDPSLAERIEETRRRYGLPRLSLAACVVRLQDAGFPEQVAVRIVRGLFDQAVAQQDAYREPWAHEIERIIASRREARVS